MKPTQCIEDRHLTTQPFLEFSDLSSEQQLRTIKRLALLQMQIDQLRARRESGTTQRVATASGYLDSLVAIEETVHA